MAIHNLGNISNVVFNSNRPVHRIMLNGQVRWRKASDAPTVSLNSRTQNSIVLLVKNNDWGGTAYARRGTGAWQSARIEDGLQTTFNFSGLTAGTTYSFQVYFIADEKKESITVSRSYATEAAPVRATSPYLSLASRTTTSLTIRVMHQDAAVGYTSVTVNGVTKSTGLMTQYTQENLVFTGLSGGTSYTASGVTIVSGKLDSLPATATFETEALPPLAATIFIYASYGGQATISYSGTYTGSMDYRITFYSASGGSQPVMGPYEGYFGSGTGTQYVSIPSYGWSSYKGQTLPWSVSLVTSGSGGGTYIASVSGEVYIS